MGGIRFLAIVGYLEHDHVSRGALLPQYIWPGAVCLLVRSKIGLDWSRLGSEVGWVGGSRRTVRFVASSGEPIGSER